MRHFENAVPSFVHSLILMRCLLVAGFLVLLPRSASATENFYNGKTITLIIGSAPGVGYDTYSRLLAGHIGDHLEGRPRVIPQNMPGAGSIRAANYLYNSARKDGTVIGMLDQAIYLNQILGTPELKIDAPKFNWIGRIFANSAVLFARREAPVQKIEDAFGKALIVSVSGTASKLNWTVLKNVLGMKFTLIQGYQGTGDSLLALQRGEVDALSMEWPVLRVMGGPLIRDRKINLLLQTGVQKAVDLPQVPRMIDLGRNEDERRLLEFFSSPALIGRSIVAPPAMPRERVEELRRAFMAAMQDPLFLADLRRARLDISPLSGEELQGVVAGEGNIPAALIERARHAAEMTNEPR
jgi:tripartite-type tricarboxylate transporter receptor subunit TctC